MSRLSHLLLMVIVGLAACNSKTTEAVLFFPVDSLLNNHVRELTIMKAELSKTARIGSEESSVTYIPDGSAWMKELETFYHINAINKPVNKSMYIASDTTDPQSGMKVRSFHTSEEIPVVYFKVYFTEDPGKPAKIEALVRESNSMYQGTRRLEMKFEDVNNKSVLKGYSITGGQQMFIADSVQYRITGVVSIPR